MDDGVKQKAVSIGDDLAFSAIHFLARVITAHAFIFGRFGRLAVDHSCAGVACIALRTLDPK